jgi:hypothetical protein
MRINYVKLAGDILIASLIASVNDVHLISCISIYIYFLKKSQFNYEGDKKANENYNDGDYRELYICEA